MGIALIFFKVGVIFFVRKFGNPDNSVFLENIRRGLNLLKCGPVGSSEFFMF